MIKYGKAFDVCFIGRVLHDFTFHDQFVCIFLRAFLTLMVLPRDAEETMQRFVQPMSFNFTLFDSYMYQNKTSGMSP